MFILDDNTYVERLKVPIISFGNAVEIGLNNQKKHLSLTKVKLKFEIQLFFY